MGKKRVLVAMSGGVDSSVCALLLRERGYDVTGVTFHLFENDDLATPLESTCCSLSDVEDAKAVARRLGFEHYTLNAKKLFGKEVIDRFCVGYLENRTPNPCIDCNRYVKFEALRRWRRELGFDYVATGHYARCVLDEDSGRFLLKTGVDRKKDQSYVLFRLTQDDLAHLLLPLGELAKDEVRERAEEAGLVTAEKPDSQDICFAPDGDYRAFIEHRLAGLSACEVPDEARKSGVESSAAGQASQVSRVSRAALEPGPIVNRAGKVLGTHKGLASYTLGQRKGLGIAAGEPLFVCAKDLTTRTLVVGTAEEVLVQKVWADDVSIIAEDFVAFEHPRTVTAKTHYRQTAQRGTARVWREEEELGGWRLEVTFDSPQRPCAPGQSLVLYDGETVLGGGIISGSAGKDLAQE